MSVFRSFVARRSPLVSYGVVQRAGFHQSIAFTAGKETKLHTEGRADEVEAEKAKSLKEQKEGKGNWKEELASDSESIVKADRAEHGSTEETIKKLQEEGKKMAEQQK
ncbi:hypothetical protein BDV95DRAFT_497194 [Massariosphaeria phaeospora]|uniref:Uncharacterized protein n=1 Tax=Massariosphaeria phaeospora TaxID=100035 RepID=A0A7C8M9V7_9PLEO|nr:hypothetical protein BDV95DRAFT_497194 [Massariosphaeria phaeospora]